MRDSMVVALRRAILIVTICFAQSTHDAFAASEIVAALCSPQGVDSALHASCEEYCSECYDSSPRANQQSQSSDCWSSVEKPSGRAPFKPSCFNPLALFIGEDVRGVVACESALIRCLASLKTTNR
jgi:hypothetical protein